MEKEKLDYYFEVFYWNRREKSFLEKKQFISFFMARRLKKKIIKEYRKRFSKIKKDKAG
jgi:hypothetical protein